MNLQGKVGNKLFQIVVLPLEMFYLLAGGVSHRVSGDTLFLHRPGEGGGLFYNVSDLKADSPVRIIG